MKGRIEISKKSADGTSRGKTTNTIPSSNNNPRFGGVRSTYPMHLATASNSWVISRLLRATLSARGVGPLLGREGVGLFVSRGTTPPRYLMTTPGRMPRRFQLTFFHRERWTMNNYRMVYSLPSKVSASVAPGRPSSIFTLTKCSGFLVLSSRFANFRRCSCDCFLYRIRKVSGAQIGGLSWTQR